MTQPSPIIDLKGILDQYANNMKERSEHHLGYPYTLGQDWSELASITGFSINNLGDPFVESNYGVQSRYFELEVLRWFAKLWHLPNDKMWGYVTACGTEGNMQGILLGRDLLKQMNGLMPVLIASHESHYSVFKAARMFGMDAVRISTREDGEMDYEDLLARVSSEQRDIVLSMNIGTTVRGAVDHVDRAINVLTKAGYRPHNSSSKSPKFFVHCDGALNGIMIPFVEGGAYKQFDFTRPIGSIAVSGHKFLGTPMPCGVVIARSADINATMTAKNNIEYLSSIDSTIMGSRNGHAPVYMWYAISMKGHTGIRDDVERCISNARSLRDMLVASGVRRVLLNPHSCTVVFERPENNDFVHRWQLACQGDVAHVVVMPCVTLKMLDLFVSELRDSGKNGVLSRSSSS